MDTERLAVAAVMEKISMTECLTAYINSGDTEPTWDGEVYVYSDKSKCKEKLINTVPVQVKGRVSDRINSTASFQADASDLRNYLKRSGTILFLVEITSDGKDKKVYYASLLPTKLRGIIDALGTQKSKVIPLIEYPVASNEQENIFKSFIENSKLQSSFISTKLMTMNDVALTGELTEITLVASGHNFTPNDPMGAIFNNEVYMYHSVPGSKIPHPLAEMPKDICITDFIDCIISVRSKEYYSSVQRSRSKDTITIKIGQSTSFSTSCESGKISSIKIATADSLQEFILDLEFILDMVEAGQFEIQGNVFKVNPNEEELKSFGIEKQKRNLVFTRRMRTLFQMIGVDKNIALSSISKSEWDHINTLMVAFLDNKPVHMDTKNEQPIAKIAVPGGEVAVWLYPTGEGSGNYRVEDFFKALHPLAVGNETITNPVSQFVILKKNDFLTLLNIDYPKVIDSFKEIPISYAYLALATQTVLEMLLAFDEGSMKNLALLDAAGELMRWIVESDTNNDAESIAIGHLNLLQIVRRQRNFSKDEIGRLCAITENGNFSPMTKAGAYLLLNNPVAAEIQLDKITPKEKNEFLKYPICQFMFSRDSEARTESD